MLLSEDRVAAFAVVTLILGFVGCAGALGAPSGNASTDFVHPLEPPIYSSGSFAEYRSHGRYHLGLDYKTFNRSGLPVRAVRVGTVIAINVSDRGYGNAIWMRSGADQYTFAHLRDFRGRFPELEWIRRSVELLVPAGTSLSLPGWYRFRSGEHMAHSGESGSGAPHLHFEILRGGRYLDPLSTDLRLADRTAPELLTLFASDRATTESWELELDPTAAAPQPTQADSSETSKTQGVHEAHVTKRFRVKDGRPVLVRAGGVRLAIGAFDTMAAQNRNGVAGWELRVGNTVVYRNNIQRLHLGQLYRADEVYDPARTVIGQSYAYRLYEGGRGVLHGKAGEERDCLVAVLDANGNRGEVSVRLRFQADLPSSGEPKTAGLTRIASGQSAALQATAAGGRLVLRFAPGSLHLPGHFAIRPLEVLPPDSLQAPDGRTVFRRVGPMFEVLAESAYYRAGLSGEAEFPAPPPGTALYSYNLTTKRWQALAFARGRGGRVVYRFTYRTSGPIAQLTDLDAPRIARPFLWEDPAAAPADLLERTLVVSDRGMGVRARGFSVLLDGRTLPHQWVADRGALVIRIPRRLIDASGSMLAIRAKDFAGNASDWWTEFLPAPQAGSQPTNQ